VDLSPRLGCARTDANGQLALGTYRLDPVQDRFLAVELVFTPRGARIADVTAFRLTSSWK